MGNLKSLEELNQNWGLLKKKRRELGKVHAFWKTIKNGKESKTLGGIDFNLFLRRRHVNPFVIQT